MNQFIKISGTEYNRSSKGPFLININSIESIEFNDDEQTTLLIKLKTNRLFNAKIDDSTKVFLDMLK